MDVLYNFFKIKITFKIQTLSFVNKIILKIVFSGWIFLVYENAY